MQCAFCDFKCQRTVELAKHLEAKHRGSTVHGGRHPLQSKGFYGRTHDNEIDCWCGQAFPGIHPVHGYRLSHRQTDILREFAQHLGKCGGLTAHLLHIALVGEERKG